MIPVETKSCMPRTPNIPPPEETASNISPAIPQVSNVTTDKVASEIYSSLTTPMATPNLEQQQSAVAADPSSTSDNKTNSGIQFVSANYRWSATSDNSLPAAVSAPPQELSTWTAPSEEAPQSSPTSQTPNSLPPLKAMDDRTPGPAPTQNTFLPPLGRRTSTTQSSPTPHPLQQHHPALHQQQPQHSQPYYQLPPSHFQQPPPPGPPQPYMHSLPPQQYYMHQHQQQIGMPPQYAANQHRPAFHYMPPGFGQPPYYPASTAAPPQHTAPPPHHMGGGAPPMGPQKFPAYSGNRGTAPPMSGGPLVDHHSQGHSIYQQQGQMQNGRFFSGYMGSSQYKTQLLELASSREIKRRTKTGCLTCRKRRIKVRFVKFPNWVF